MSKIAVLNVAIRREQDILLARQRARLIARFLGFSAGDVTRITTALSEIARNAFEYGGGGSAAFLIDSTSGDRQQLVIRVADEGPGIADVASVLDAGFQSSTGMGIGIRGSRALMDTFEITSDPGRGTSVVMAKDVPRATRRFGPVQIAELTTELAKAADATPFGELQLQNQALLGALEEVTRRQAEIERLMLIADDARNRAEAAQLIAERSIVVRERFMALTTHELRTPLQAITGYLDLIAAQVVGDLNEKQKSFFARAQQGCAHLLGLTNDFLDMAQGDAGRLKVARHPGAARHVMSEALALVTPQAVARNVTVSLTEQTDHIMYVGDAARVRQVLVNVIGNAVSFTPPGGTVHVIAQRAMTGVEGSELSGGPWCTIRVEDTGPGIPADKLGHVFEPFVQLSDEGQKSRKGSGLGLTVSRQLAQLMGGDLTVSSTGSGAVFTLWLAEEQRPEAASGAKAPGGDASPARPIAM